MTQTPHYQVTDPATGEVTETFPFATDAEVEQALAAATEAFAAWRLRPVAERAAVVKRIAELFTERARGCLWPARAGRRIPGRSSSRYPQTRAPGM